MVFSILLSLGVTVGVGILFNWGSPFVLAGVSLASIIFTQFVFYRLFSWIVLSRWQRRAEDLTETRIFTMSNLGALFLIVISIIGVLLVVYGESDTTLYVGLLFSVVPLIKVARFFRLSPWFIGPGVIATPEGIQLLKHFIPWGDVESVTARSSNAYNLSIKTKGDRGLYCLDNKICENSQLFSVYVFGASRISIAAYLSTRAKLQNAKLQ